MANSDDRSKDKGFWDGGSAGHGSNGQSSGRTGGYPGKRKPNRLGVRTDIEFPREQMPSSEPKK